MAIVTTTVDADGVALITLDDPARPANVTTPELTAELLAAVDRVATEPTIRGAVIASGKPGRFVAGGDILDFVGAWERGMSEAEAFEISHRWNRELRRIERCGKPFAAAINGAALGGGFELALLCQHRVLVDDPRAVVGLVEVGLGLLPAGGGSQRLPRLIGIDAALRLMLDARRLAPPEALAAGLVDAVVPAERLLAVARAWVLEGHPPRQPWDERAAPDAAQLEASREHWQQLVDAQFGRHYPAPHALLRAVFDGLPLPLDDGLRVESTCFAPLLAGVVARNLMRTGFVYRGEADKRARQAAARLGESAVVLPEYDGAAAPPPRGSACLWLWPDAAQARLAEIAVAADAPPSRVDIALSQAAARGVTPVVLPPGRPSFVARLLEHRGSLQALAAEGRRALAEGAIASPADADLASVLGGLCPPWTGGVISCTD
ncbi:enoyl-CoA hydratase/isomerase family protein [Aquincola sp. S2]|uniref:Enoyl-CoA hydratase/isomerase family protein n=1 Tax=Pseudaquabacterium terrae TaxID=2732868 RepID=A0ABX2EAM1_9BURK|nr:enoyl-CoA hydratase-related protein [Aquabacterium terrae]NRF65888.1 enoyl-CoA hydratase/isomerase family protein [Aquabacterium terrae]